MRTAARFARGASTPVRALVTSTGRVVLGWHTVTVREGRRVQLEAGVATRRLRGGWHDALLERSVLDTQSFAADAAAIPVVDARGDVYVTWTGRQRRATGVRIAKVSTSARISRPTLLSAETQSATLDDAAAGPQGRIVVTYSEQLGSAGVRTWARLRPATGAFAPPEPLTPAGEAGLVGSRVAFSPLTGRPVVVRPLVGAGRGALAAAAGSD